MRIRYTKGSLRGKETDLPSRVAEALISAGFAEPAEGEPLVADKFVHVTSAAFSGQPAGGDTSPSSRDLTISASGDVSGGPREGEGGGRGSSSSQTLPSASPHPPPSPAPQQKPTAYDALVGLVGNDLVEIYGDFGTGKSRFAAHVALEAQDAGKNVIYLDTENSLPRSIASRLSHYEYVGIKLQPLIDRVAGLKPGFDLVVVDSIGFPVLCNFFELGLRDRLTALGKMILLRAHLKDYAIRNRGLALATNQPVSEFSYSEMSPRPIPPGQPLEPFGGKGAFISKLLLRTEVLERGERTRVGIHTYKARDLPFDKRIAEFSITSTGTELRWL